MRRIDAEYDIPQFLASALARIIATNDFRLPSTDRGKFQKLPDEVIVRIERIVLASYVDAGEDVGGDALRQHLSQQALAARREMIANRELIPKTVFRQRLGVSELRLERLVADGRVFAMVVDDSQYFPALLADPIRKQKRLQAICQIILPAPANSRLDFLASRHGSLGDRRPKDMLENDDDFESLKRLAIAWTSEWWRTNVRLYKGEYEIGPADVEPLYSAATEVDPRVSLWERASAALNQPGYQWPLGPYPDIRRFSVFVERQAAGQSKPISEACVQIAVEGESIQIRVMEAPGTVLQSAKTPAGRRKTVVDIAKRAIAHLRALNAAR